jgi:hypothetical protein
MDSSGGSILQHLYNLMQALNPHERSEFLRTHNLAVELGGAGHGRTGAWEV